MGGTLRHLSALGQLVLAMPARDKEGYLINLNEWDEKFAEQIALETELSLSPAHWEIIMAVRAFYIKYESSPASRALIKWLGMQLGKDKGNSLYVMGLFPGSPAKFIAKIAGLPRPSNCI